MIVNQYGRPRKEGSAFPETIEGRLTEEELIANLNDQVVDTGKYRFTDEEYFKSKEYRLEDIEVPLLTVANWVRFQLYVQLLHHIRTDEYTLGWHSSAPSWQR